MAPPNAPSSPPVDLRARYNVPANWQEPVMYFDPERLPALPPIPDPALAQQAFQHRTSPHLKFRDGNRTTPYDRDLNSYEPLEGIGDRLLNYAVYRCLRQRFTGATAGILGDLAQRLTANRTLSYLSVAYSLLDRLEYAGWDDLTQNQKVAADLFEAYVGALGQCETVAPGSTQLWSWMHALFTPDVWNDLAPTIHRLEDVARAYDHASTTGPPTTAPDRWSCPDCERSDLPPTPAPRVVFDCHDVRKGWHASLWLGESKLGCGRAPNKRVAEVLARNRALPWPKSM